MSVARCAEMRDEISYSIIKVEKGELSEAHIEYQVRFNRSNRRNNSVDTVSLSLIMQ